jgi:hypothetical protein
MEIAGEQRDRRPVLGDLDGGELAEPGAIGGVVDEDPVAPEHARDLREHPIDVGDVLDHVTAGDHTEGFVSVRQRLRTADGVVDRVPLLAGVGPRRGDRSRRGVDATDAKTHPGELLGDQAAAAADVEQGSTGRIEREPVEQHPLVIGNATGVDERPEHREQAVVVPPLVGEPVVDVVVDLATVDGTRRAQATSHALHDAH